MENIDTLEIETPIENHTDGDEIYFMYDELLYIGKYRSINGEYLITEITQLIRTLH